MAKRALVAALATAFVAPYAVLAQSAQVPPGLSSLTGATGDGAPSVAPSVVPAAPMPAVPSRPTVAPMMPNVMVAPAVTPPAPAASAARPAMGPTVTIKGQPKVENVRTVPSVSEALRSETGGPAPDSLADTRLPVLKGDEASLKPFVLHTRVGVNEVIRLSSNFLNRISTPFADPVIVDISGSQSKIVGSEVFVLPKEGAPTGIYLFDKSNPSQMISLTLVPQPGIPGQNVLIKVENFRALGNLGLTPDGRQSDQRNGQPTDHEGVLSNLLINAINGRIPGFSPVPLEAGVAKIEDVQITPDVVFQGYYLDVYRYQLTNQGARAVALNEGVFYREGIKAVSFFPRDTLAPNDSTFVFLVANKGMEKNPASFLSSRDSAVTGADKGVAR